MLAPLSALPCLQTTELWASLGVKQTPTTPSMDLVSTRSKFCLANTNYLVIILLQFSINKSTARILPKPMFFFVASTFPQIITTVRFYLPPSKAVYDFFQHVFIVVTHYFYKSKVYVISYFFPLCQKRIHISMRCFKWWESYLFRPYAILTRVIYFTV